MKCVICGRESTKPVCGVCAKQIAMDRPFLLDRGLLVSEWGGEPEYRENGFVFPDEIRRLNEMGKRRLMGEDDDGVMLAKFAILFHRRFSFILDSMEIDPGYYLKLAREFVEREESDEARYLLATIYMEMKEPEEAEKVLEGIWRKSRDYAILYGKALVSQGKWGRAVEVYNEILGDNKEDAEIWKLLAEALYTSGNYEDAERAYLKALQINKDDYEAWYLRGLCLRRMGKWGGALQSFQTAIRKNPRYREAYEGMLEILMERGMYSRALEILKKMKEEGFDVDERIREVEGMVE